MKFICRPSALKGTIAIPNSKSHTIRAIAIASLAEGESQLIDPLVSDDTLSAAKVYQQLGAKITKKNTSWQIKGFGGKFQSLDQDLDVGNSGTTLRILLGSCSLQEGTKYCLTGDQQLQKRPCGPLVEALRQLGASIVSEKGNDCAPFQVCGPISGGRATIHAQTSQYVSSLLLSCPLGEGDTELSIPLLYEKPYVEMTLEWLKMQNLDIQYTNLENFRIPGKQHFTSFTRKIPADFSSATFFLVAGALGNNDITCTGLDMTDFQSDKAVINFLREMGANIHINNRKKEIRVRASQLKGIDIDMNDCPDALPMMAVAGCFSQGTTRLYNVPQARMKETDRIAVMEQELRKLGGCIEQTSDGLIIKESSLQGNKVSGHGDHRIVMALATIGTLIKGETEISSAEAASITFPTFRKLLLDIGGDIEKVSSPEELS